MKFQVGHTYNTRSICDYNCIFSYRVMRRTAKFVTFYDSMGTTKRVGVKVDENGNEWVLPSGSYSMAPVIRAHEPRAELVTR